MAVQRGNAVSVLTVSQIDSVCFLFIFFLSFLNLLIGLFLYINSQTS